MPIARVLLVDDDDDIRDLGALALRTLGRWAVSTASSGAEAIDAARRARPDVILLDMRMPGWSGAETLAHLRGDPATANVPVIALTAVEPGGAALAGGLAGVIQKPFDPVTLPHLVARLVEEHAEVCAACEVGGAP